MQRKTVLLLFGGESSEHDVSVSSARNVFAAIDDTKYEVVLGYIDPSGKWWLLDRLDTVIDYHGSPQLLPALGGGSFVTMPGSKVVKPDVILPILHGENGEDGSVQGLAQLLHIPIVGCDMTASAVGMDKLVSKQILTAHDITVVPYEVHHASDALPDFNHLTMTLGVPLFVKPTRSGSSVGVSKVYSEDDLLIALGEAHKYGDVALIEHGVTARELEVAVIGTPPKHHVSSVGEVIPGEDFYSYEDKYSSASKSEVAIPANIDQKLSYRVQAQASRIYELLGCQGLARIDFFLSDDNQLYFNEINTIPGFTNSSMYPKLWRHEGVTYSSLIEKLLDDALSRGTIEVQETVEE